MNSRNTMGKGKKERAKQHKQEKEKKDISKSMEYLFNEAEEDPLISRLPFFEYNTKTKSLEYSTKYLDKMKNDDGDARNILQK